MLNHFILGVLFTLFFTSIDAGVPPEMAELAQQLHNECVGQTGADESLMATINNKQGFPDDAKLKCYIKCLMTELAVIDDDGEVDIEAFVGLMPDNMKETSEKTFKACGTKKGADVCDTVYLTHKCYYEMDPAVSTDEWLIVEKV